MPLVIKVNVFPKMTSMITVIKLHKTKGMRQFMPFCPWHCCSHEEKHVRIKERCNLPR